MRHALVVDPTCARCHNTLGRLLGERGQYDAAVEHFGRGVQLRPEFRGLRENLALALTLSGRPAEAIRHLEYLVERYPTEVPLRTRLGATLLQLGDVPAAAAHLREAVRLGRRAARRRRSSGWPSPG